MNVGKLGRGLVAVTLVGLFGAACTPDPGPVTPTPSAVSTATPTVSASPTETAQEREERVAYDAAEKAYRTFRAEYNRVLRAGGAKEPTAVMKQTAGGEYLKTFTEIVQAYKGLGSYAEGTERTVYVRPSGYSPKEIAMQVCEDSRQVKDFVKSGKQVGVGELRTATIEVRRVDRNWKLWSGSGQSVKSCD